jgi:hypothetical protein
MGMSPQDYEYLLVAANLTHFHQKRGFSIKLSKWKLFLEGHLFVTANCTGTVEVEAKKLDLNAHVNGVSPKNRQQVYFIQIGVLTVHTPQKVELQKDGYGQMIITPPRLNGLCLKQQPFRQCMEKYKWNYILEDNVDEDHKDEDNDKDNKDDSNVDSKDTAASSPTTSNKKRKYNAVMVMVAPDDEDMAKSDMAKSYPHLSRALGGEDGFDPTNPSVLKSMHSLLRELNGLLRTSYELNTTGSIVNLARLQDLPWQILAKEKIQILLVEGF